MKISIKFLLAIMIIGNLKQMEAAVAAPDEPEYQYDYVFNRGEVIRALNNEDLYRQAQTYENARFQRGRMRKLYRLVIEQQNLLDAYKRWLNQEEPRLQRLREDEERQRLDREVSEGMRQMEQRRRNGTSRSGDVVRF